MRITKLITGLALIAWAVFTLAQAFNLNVNPVGDGGATLNGPLGLTIAGLYLVAGMIDLTTQPGVALNSDVTVLVLVLIVWLMGISEVGFSLDLTLWSYLALGLVSLNVIWDVRHLPAES